MRQGITRSRILRQYVEKITDYAENRSMISDTYSHRERLHIARIDGGCDLDEAGPIRRHPSVAAAPQWWGAVTLALVGR